MRMEKINNEKVKISMEFGYQMMILEVLLERFGFKHERLIDICHVTGEYTTDYTIDCPVYDRIRVITLKEIEAFAKNWKQSYMTHKKGLFVNSNQENIKTLEYIKNELSEFVSYLDDLIKGCRLTINEDLLEFKKSIQI